jgi:hypothetical protein
MLNGCLTFWSNLGFIVKLTFVFNKNRTHEHKVTPSAFHVYCFFASAQTGILSGKVVDSKSGETLIGATVVIDENSTLGASTDMDGNFTIPKIPAGKHHVKVRYIGYKEKQDEIEVRPNNVTNLVS